VAISLVLPGLPTGNGASVIQTSNFVISAVYKEIDYDAALARVKTLGQALFFSFPGKDPGPLFHWYERTNMVNGTESLATLIKARGTMVNKTLSPANTVAGATKTNVAFKSFVGEAHAWHPVRLTTTDGQMYYDVAYHASYGTVFLDPELQTYVLPTSGYQAKYEIDNFLFKPVAATTPDSTPIFRLVNGRNPVE
jgi:hypothetical protein